MAAVLASVARTAERSTDTGKTTGRHWRPSIVRSTTPLRPTSQQTADDGDEPATRSDVAPACCGCHVAPPSLERSTDRPPAIRQRLMGSGETMSTTALAFLSSANESVVARSNARDGADAEG
jgi:hypothetical protein